jgi:hypothetical protein
MKECSITLQDDEGNEEAYPRLLYRCLSLRRVVLSSLQLHIHDYGNAGRDPSEPLQPPSSLIHFTVA